jgi:hypothetical protein
MFALSKLSSFAALGTLVVLAGLRLPAHADELAQNLGPVGPHEPILTTVGSKAQSSPSMSQTAAIAVSTLWCGTSPTRVVTRRLVFGSI